MAHRAEGNERTLKIVPHICFTGVGKVNAALNLSQALCENRHAHSCNLVINIGSAGSGVYPVGTWVNPTRFYQYDMDVSAAGLPRYRTPFETYDFLHIGCRAAGITATEIYTADRFFTDYSQVQSSADAQLSGVSLLPVADMESYAIAKTCLHYQIPFLCLKIISDGADADAKSEWLAGRKLRADRFNKMLTDIFAGNLKISLPEQNTVLNGKLANTGGATENMMYETVAALLVITLCNLISPAGFTHLSEITVSDWLWLLFLSVLCTLYAYTAILYLLKTLTPFHISLGTNLEPIYGIVLALLIFGEREILSLPFYIAAGVMLSTVISYPLIKSRLSSKKTDKIAA
ncbi:hypothetical protein CHS0354_035306 [Potamilus streckersoni]|uniref:Nucleoside phosphorylase domain-containing protein n=1 Tax=Potamilus streckersoni TaxID=2493646 RepID=A0AAE0S2V2_9BIVA|nr:hypothetical protein CHS0354_035306 [Potamilus streckersoni]